MARKTIEVPITEEGRDKGKVYVITEMSARKAEKWAGRALIALSRGASDAVKIEIDENSGWAGIMSVGLGALGGISWAEAEPLMDEMMTCVQLRPDPSKPGFTRALLVDEDVEEVRTLLRLRQEALELHGGFSFAGIVSRLKSLMSTLPASSNTKTSPTPSG